MSNYAGTCKSIPGYNLVCNFFIWLLAFQIPGFVVHFSNVFWHGNETFPKGSSWNEIATLLVPFHLPYMGVKICFDSCRYQIRNFSLVSHSCRFSTRVALVLFV